MFVFTVDLSFISGAVCIVAGGAAGAEGRDLSAGSGAAVERFIKHNKNKKVGRAVKNQGRESTHRYIHNTTSQGYKHTEAN